MNQRKTHTPENRLPLKWLCGSALLLALMLAAPLFAQAQTEQARATEETNVEETPSTFAYQMFVPIAIAPAQQSSIDLEAGAEAISQSSEMSDSDYVESLVESSIDPSLPMLVENGSGAANTLDAPLVTAEVAASALSGVVLTAPVIRTGLVEGTGFPDARKIVRDAAGILYATVRIKDGKIYRVYLERSLDGGRTWILANGGAPISDPTQVCHQRNAAVAVEQLDANTPMIHIVWYGPLHKSNDGSLASAACQSNPAARNDRQIQYARYNPQSDSVVVRYTHVVPGYDTLAVAPIFWQEHPVVAVGGANLVTETIKLTSTNTVNTSTVVPNPIPTTKTTSKTSKVTTTSTTSNGTSTTNPINDTVTTVTTVITTKILTTTTVVTSPMTIATTLSVNTTTNTTTSTVTSANVITVLWEGKSVTSANRSKILWLSTKNGGNTWDSNDITVAVGNLPRLPDLSRPALLTVPNNRKVLYAFAYATISNTVSIAAGDPYSQIAQIVWTQSLDSGRSWKNWQFVAAGSKDQRHLSAVFDKKNLLHIVWRQREEGADATKGSRIHYATYQNSSWVKSVLPAIDPTRYQLFPSITSYNGTTVIAWSESDASGYPAEAPMNGVLYLKEKLPDGSWTPNMLVSTNGIYPSLGIAGVSATTSSVDMVWTDAWQGCTTTSNCTVIYAQVQ